MNFFKNWVSYFIIMIIVTLGFVLIGGVSYWLFHFLIGKVFFSCNLYFIDYDYC